MPMQSLISRDFLSVEKFSGCLQLRWAVNFQLSLLPPSLGVTWKNKKNWACYLVVCLLRSFLRCTSEWKKKGKLKVARAFLRLPALDFWSVRYSHWILSIRWICSVMLCLFCSSTCGASNISVSIVTIFGEPRLLFLQTIPSVSPFSRSPSGAERVLPPNLHRGSPQGAQVLRFEDFHCCCSYSLVVAIRRFPLLLFLFPCGFHVFALLFGWFWSIAPVLWSCSCCSSKFIPFSWY